MRLFRDLSIGAKLIILGAASSGVALLFCCTGFVFNDVTTIRAAKIKELRGQADLLAFNGTSALTSRDPAAAEHLLASLRLQPSVESGYLFDDQGQVLARYVKDGCDDHTPSAAPKGSGSRFTDNDQIEVSRQVSDAGECVGSVYLVANMDELHGQLSNYSVITASMIFCALGTSLLFSIRLQRAISRPVVALATAARKITASGDYSVRVEPNSKDELGDLCLAFNRMLVRIEASDHALKEAHDRLEDRVKQRTAELEKEIAQRRLIEDELVRSRDAADAANRAKNEFLANMSHEIRTPLNGILGFSELLTKGGDAVDEAEHQEYVQAINTCGNHLLTVINDILDLSKIEAERLELERIPCSLQELIREVLSVLRVKAQEKNLALECEWRGRAPETIQTDPVRVRQLLTNIVGNAIKFTDAGYVRVVTEFNQDLTNPGMIIQVIDTGVGIPQDKVRAVFEPFVQADNSVTRKYGGTGLGLAISQRIAKALGGDLTVQSTPGKGSTFTAVIDTGNIEGVAMLSEGSAEAVGKKRDHNETGEIALPPVEILLVEDDATNRKLIRLILCRAGANVTAAENGQIGVNLATETEFDLILMDMQMPIMDGYTAATLLRQQGATLPIIALTAHAMKEDEEKCRSAGCSGFLTLPIGAQQLLPAIRDAVADSRPAPSEPSANEPPLVSSLPMDDPISSRDSSGLQLAREMPHAHCPVACEE